MKGTTTFIICILLALGLNAQKSTEIGYLTKSI